MQPGKEEEEKKHKGEVPKKKVQILVYACTCQLRMVKYKVFFFPQTYLKIAGKWEGLQSFGIREAEGVHSIWTASN